MDPKRLHTTGLWQLCFLSNVQRAQVPHAMRAPHVSSASSQAIVMRPPHPHPLLLRRFFRSLFRLVVCRCLVSHRKKKRVWVCVCVCVGAIVVWSHFFAVSHVTAKWSHVTKTDRASSCKVPHKIFGHDSKHPKKNYGASVPFSQATRRLCVCACGM